MALTLTLGTLLVLAQAHQALAFFCRYPIQRLTGLADLGGQFVQLDVGVRLIGPECEIVVDGGRLRCRSVGARAFGQTFTPPARGRCPGRRGVLVNGSYGPRSDDEGIADVVLEAQLEHGGTCTISGVTLATVIGGPIAALKGRMVCTTPATTISATVELLRPPVAVVH
jgi:hypothetical protein